MKRIAYLFLAPLFLFQIHGSVFSNSPETILVTQKAQHTVTGPGDFKYR